MNTRRSLIVCGLVTLACALYSVLVARRLQEVVPIHWNIAGEPDQYGSKWLSLLIAPLVLILMSVMMLVLPKISPKKFDIDSFRGTFNYIMVILTCMFAVIHVVILQATMGTGLAIDRALPATLFLFFAILGNVLGKVQRNFWMGIRTPWTLADVRVWDLTHRSAARIWTIVGAIGFLLSLIGMPGWLMVSLLLSMGIVPVLQSFFFYKRFEREGKLAS